MKVPTALGSSVDPEKLSLSVKGAAVSLIPLAAFALASFGFDITTNDLTETLNSALAAVSAVMMTWGLLRKLYVKLVG